MTFIFARNNLINDIIVITPQVFWDERWFFMETYHQKEFKKNWIKDIFVQDNHSKSNKWIFRWFHFQIRQSQTKIVRVTNWSLLDFVIDIRKKSSTYWKYIFELLSKQNKKQLFIPKWFAHGFLSLEDNTEILYKCNDYYDQKNETWIIYNDNEVNIDRTWIMQKYKINKLILSEKDERHPTLKKFYDINPF
jgi:dTDP-4-dehydrorhamnose 3,5-epimerase